MNRAAAVYSGGFSVSINPRLCHSEPVTDVTGVGIRNLLAGNLRKSAGIMCFGNGLPRQSVPQGHLLRGVDWLAMTGFFDRLKPGAYAPGLLCPFPFFRCRFRRFAFSRRHWNGSCWCAAAKAARSGSVRVGTTRRPCQPSFCRVTDIRTGNRPCSWHRNVP